jgi:hypothetical protein
MTWFSHASESLSREEIRLLVQRTLQECRSRLKCNLDRVLLLPPDLTRAHSGAGWITEMFYQSLPKSCDIFPQTFKTI